MMKQRIAWAGISVMIGLLMVAGLLLPLNSVAAPPAAPTPVSNLVASDAGNYFVVIDEGVASGGNYEAPSSLAGFEWADWQYSIDQPTPTNATTLTLEYSNDGVNWVTGPTLVAGNTTDASDITRLPLFGRYSRIVVTQGQTNSVTIQANLLAK